MDPYIGHCSANSTCGRDKRSFRRSDLRGSSLPAFFMAFCYHCHRMRAHCFGNLSQPPLAIPGPRSHGTHACRTSRPDSSSTRPPDTDPDSGTHFRHGGQPHAEEISLLVIYSQTGYGLVTHPPAESGAYLI